jgi:hypothetical protein
LGITPAAEVAADDAGLGADVGADAIGAVRDAGAAPVTPDVVAMDEAEMAGFWPRLEAQMAAAFWRPLAASGMLEGATRVVLATAGELHNLPFGPGRAAAGLDGVALCHVGSLAQVALGRGLYVAEEDGTRPAPPPPPPPTPAAVPPRRVSLMHCAAPEPQDGQKPLPPIPLVELEARICARIWRSAPGGTAVLEGDRYPWPSDAPDPPVTLAHAACHGGVFLAEGRTPQTALLLGGATVVTQSTLQAGPGAQAWLNTACVAGRGFDDIFDGDPTGIVAGALRRGTRAVAAFLPSVPDEIGLLVGVLSTLGMAEHDLSLEKTAAWTRAVFGGADRHSETARALIRRLGEELATEMAPMVQDHLEAWRRDPSQRGFRNYVNNNAASRLGPYLGLLSESIEAVEQAAPATPDATRAVLAASLSPLPDPADAKQAAALGVAVHGLTVFGDPGARVI